MWRFGCKGVAVIVDNPSSSRRSILSALASAPLARSSMRDAISASLSQHGRGGGIVTPEQFGAMGDGVADDAPALQRALDAVAHGQGGTIVLQPRVAYRCGSGLVLDASFVSLVGTALLDFSEWTGRYLRVVASSVATHGPANNYGHRGMISGAVRLRGAGASTGSIGVDFDSPAEATSAQMLVENLAVSGCGTGIRFGNRAYNNLLLRCEVFECDTCIAWPAAEDNGERNTLIGCVLYNSGTAVRISLASASLQLHGCSLDYTGRLYDVKAGSVLVVSCHHESSVWNDAPIRCSGDGAFIRCEGGWIVNQASTWGARHLVDVGRGSTVHLKGMMLHNILLTSPDPTRLPSLATGEGEFHVAETQSFEFSPLPPQLHAGRTRLGDPDFTSTLWVDQVWRIRDVSIPIVDRHGRPSDQLTLAKVKLDGEAGLAATKTLGSSAAAAFVLIALPVNGGDAVLAGFRVRRDPAHPGSDGTLLVSPTWARIDGQDEHRLPVIVRSELVGTATITPPVDRFLPVAPLASRSGRTAPPWATHFCMVVDLVQAADVTFIFNGLFADTI